MLHVRLSGPAIVGLMIVTGLTLLALGQILSAQ
jgi:hypothetical protein